MNECVVHVVDDDPAIPDSLSFLLSSADLTARTYDSALAFLAQTGDLAPGCIVTDVRMPGMTGQGRHNFSHGFVGRRIQRGRSLPDLIAAGLKEKLRARSIL